MTTSIGYNVKIIRVWRDDNIVVELSCSTPYLDNIPRLRYPYRVRIVDIEVMECVEIQGFPKKPYAVVYFDGYVASLTRDKEQKDAQ